MSNEPVPPWKFWHPLPFWHVIVIFALTNIAMTFVVVALREGLGVHLPGGAVAGGAGGFLGVVIVMGRAKKAREQSSAPPPG